jgi:pimeloyl-ACP methyl ester carboxylesterase
MPLFIAVFGCGVGHNQTSETPRQWFRTGSGRTVVMLGGGVFGAAMFAPHAEELAGEFEIIRIQTLNVQSAEAKTEMPPDYSVAQETAALHETLSHIGVAGPVDIVGSSYGAVVSLHFAATYPQKVRTVTLFEPPAFWVLSVQDFEQDSTARMMRDLTKQLTPSTSPTDEQYFRFRCLLGECPPHIPDSTEPARAEWDFRRSAMRGLAAVTSHREDESALKQLSCPVLLMSGSRSVAFHRRINELLAWKILNVEMSELEGTHTAPRSNKDGFIRQLRSFLASHE